MPDNENIKDSGSSSLSEKPDISFGSSKDKALPPFEPKQPAKPEKSEPRPQPPKQAPQEQPAPARPAPKAEGSAAERPKPAENAGQRAGNKAVPPPRSAKRPPQGANGANGANGLQKPRTDLNKNGAPKKQGSPKNGSRPPRPGTPANGTARADRTGTAAAAAGKKRPPNGKKPATLQKGGAGRVKPESGTPVKKAHAPKPQTKQTVSSNTGNTANTAAKKKVKFTRKQALQVTGLILVLFLIFGLAVFLIFDHYFNLIGGPAEDVTNSSPKLYSDVDYSKPDTFEKSVEDEKLKELTNKAEKITSSDVMNILLVGEDLRDTAEQDAGNTDVMMLISVNTKDNTITLTSIMRDCYVWFGSDETGWYSDRINAAYWYGGMKLTKSTIEDYLNVKIDRYVLVNFKVFIDIVDALGGIDMHVTDLEANGDPNEDPHGDNTRGMQNPLDEQNKYLGNKKKTDYIKKGGDLHLNGNQALAYARLRHVGNADYERTQRQRKVIKEMIKESRHMSLVEMDQLANKVFPQVKTDVTKAELAGLLLEMLNYRNYKIQEFRVPADDTFTNEFIDGKDVLQVDFTANQELFRELAYGTVKVKEKSSEKME